MQIFKKTCISILFIIALSASSSFAQYFEENHLSGVGIPYFDVSIDRQFTPNENEQRVLILGSILNDDLTFIKSDTSGYDAGFEWIIAIYNSDEKLIFSRTSSEKYHVQKFKQTNSRVLKRIVKNQILLNTGNYKFLIRAIDLNSKKSSQRKIPINITKYYDQQIAISDLMLLDKITIDSSGWLSDFEPVFIENFTDRQGVFYIYFDVYTKKAETPVEVKYEFITAKKKVDFDSTLQDSMPTNIKSFLIKIHKNLFKASRYDLTLSVKIDSVTITRKKELTFFWKTVPSTSEDIHSALLEMKYILPSDSMNAYIDADLEIQKAFFKRFWSERDPNPVTKKNELMDEYFKRVNYANQHFSSFSSPGWISDRGRILVKFGPPDDIERHPFELDTRAYIIWRYYNLKKTFVFEDYSGFGDYRLNPNYTNIEYE